MPITAADKRCLRHYSLIPELGTAEHPFSIDLTRNSENVSQEQLQEALLRTETLTRVDSAQAFDNARIIEHHAAQRGFEKEYWRAQLLMIDVQIRQGQLAAGGLALRELASVVRELDDAYLTARVHRVNANLYWSIADLDQAIAHAHECVAQLPPDAAAAAVDEHLLCRADTQATTDCSDVVLEIYDRVLEGSAKRGDVLLKLICLNNKAFALHEAGRVADARPVVDKLEEYAREVGLTLPWQWLDTVASVRYSEGHYHDTIAIVAPRVASLTSYDREDISGIIHCLLTLSRAYRACGGVAEAEVCLDRLDECISLRELKILRVEVMTERAAWHALKGNYQQAYEIQAKAYDQRKSEVRMEQSARTRTLLVLHRANDAAADRDKFRRMSYTDALTGLPNRRFLEEHLERAKNDVTAVLIDLDHFKSINDLFSHAVGDKVLQDFATNVASILGMPTANAGKLSLQNPADIDALVENATLPFVTRYGGEEFAVVAPATDCDKLLSYLEELRDNLQTREWPALRPDMRVTFSAGVVVGRGNVSTTDVWSEADTLLYQAKAAGRNRIFGPTEVLRP